MVYKENNWSKNQKSVINETDWKAEKREKGETCRKPSIERPVENHPKSSETSEKKFTS